MLFVCLVLFSSFCLLIAYMWKLAFENDVKYVDVSIEELPKSLDDFKLFFISDIHKRVIADEIIDSVKGKVDIVIIGGDLTEQGVPFERVETNIKKLKQLGPTYFVWGNNDYEVDHHQLDSLLLSYGIKILDNTAVTFESDNGDKLILIGVDDMKDKRDNLDLAIQDVQSSGFRILVSHNPNIIKKIHPKHDIRFILSGHTHGGQIRIFNLGPYELGGVKQVNNMTLLTSNGYGTTGIPLRLGARPETHLVTIKSK
ncbi:metallophosphoesterase [Bacillus timonensis]|nr:metallophosphoesterase [Bacillus timonensis]